MSCLIEFLQTIDKVRRFYILRKKAGTSNDRLVFFTMSVTLANLKDEGEITAELERCATKM